jgi:hypothetical protein
MHIWLELEAGLLQAHKLVLTKYWYVTSGKMNVQLLLMDFELH